MKKLALLFLVFDASGLFCQSFPTEPNDALFVSTDIQLFWDCFDNLEFDKHAFKPYLEHGSAGVKDFIPYRIESEKNLRKTVIERKADYEAIREKSQSVMSYMKPVVGYFYTFKELYEDAVFPPTYFVIGAFNSGGTSTKNGVIIGMEMQKDLSGLSPVITHELIHFNQNYTVGKPNLLNQSIREGAADFMAELISGTAMNVKAMEYYMAHEGELCSEFIGFMNDGSYHGWLYGGGVKDGRPNDLGYSIGYKICQAYYEKAPDKKQAIRDILNISDAQAFLESSGYLDLYLSK